MLVNPTLEVHMYANPKKANGFSIAFPYSKQAVERINLVLGAEWNKQAKTWDSVGPEVLLDMERFGVRPAWLSHEARDIAEKFREELWASLQARSIPIYDDKYGYQTQGTEFLINQRRAILADDMGLGKSKQALDAAVKVGAADILILAPKTLTYNWYDEVKLWHPDISVEILSDTIKASKSSRSKGIISREELWNDRPEIVIANYEKLQTNDWPYEINWDVVICDEATRLKNSSSVTWKLVRKISNKTHYFWALTGTPLEIKLIELYNIFSLVRPSVLGNFSRFRSQHMLTGWAGEVLGVQNIDLLRDRIGYWMLRRTKAEVLPNLPEKVYNNEFIQMTTVERKEYEQLLTEFDSFVKDHDISGGNSAINKTLRLQQYCCSPALFDIDRKGSKYENLVERINDWDGRVLVFCFFEQMIELLSKWLRADCEFHPDAVISGKVKAELRKPLVDKFNEGKLGKVFLSTDAGQQGLTITGADLVVHYSQLWNPMKMRQREDRSNRIGQTKTTNVLNMMYMDSIDYGQYLLNREREQLFEEIVDGAEEVMIRKLSPERLMRIARGRLNARVPNEVGV